MARVNLSYSMKNPGRVKFRDSFMSHAARGLAYCTQMNAQNSFGAYTGFKPAIALSDNSIIRADQLDSERFMALWNSHCSNPVHN